MSSADNNMENITPEIFERLVYVANHHRTWVRLEQSPDFRPFIIVMNGQLNLSFSPSVILTVYRPQYGYPLGHKWIITQNELEQAAMKIKSEDEGFWDRLTQNRQTLEDLGKWILRATFGLVNLELDEYELYFS